jgi:hypothetical protein
MDTNNKPTGPCRRSSDLNPPTGSLAALEARMDTFEYKLDKNTELTETIVKLFGTMEAGIKFLGWLGAVLKWAVMCVGALVSLWALINGKNK